MSARAEIISAVCNGDAEAEKFCSALVSWLHFIDDTVDRDKVLTPETAVSVSLDALIALSENLFFQKHKTALCPMLVQAFRSWGDSVRWEKSPDVRCRRAADVMKSQYHEVLWSVAYIVGGWQHLSDVTAKYRSFDFDCTD